MRLLCDAPGGDPRGADSGFLGRGRIPYGGNGAVHDEGVRKDGEEPGTAIEVFGEQHLDFAEGEDGAGEQLGSGFDPATDGLPGEDTTMLLIDLH
jgi:hypothetical protein